MICRWILVRYDFVLMVFEGVIYLSFLFFFKFGMEFCGSWGLGMLSWFGVGVNVSVVVSCYGVVG